ncbi:MAG: hypothetical protein D6805_09135 [Planctomycetota bacterium]|nr:MAG: hypothetical protein D6805_09135 [Planctomycetota bacterium]
MQVISRYCSQCNAIIAQRDFDAGHAISYKSYYYCRKCIQKYDKLQKLKEKIQQKKASSSESQSLKTLSESTVNSLPKTLPRNSRRLPTTKKSQPQQHSTLYRLLAVFTITLLLAFLLLYPQQNHKPTSTTNINLTQYKKNLSQLEQNFLHHKTNIPQLRQILQQLQKLKKNLLSTPLASTQQKLQQNIEKQLAKIYLKKLNTKIHFLLRNNLFQKALQQLSIPYPPEIQHLSLYQQEIQKLKEKVKNTQQLHNKAKNYFQQLQEKINLALAAKNYQQALQLTKQFPPQFQSTDYYDQILSLQEKIQKQWNELKEKEKQKQIQQAFLKKAKKAYEKTIQIIQQLIAKKDFIGALNAINNFPPQYRDTIWAKKIKQYKSYIAKSYLQSVQNGTIPPPQNYTPIQQWQSKQALIYSKQNITYLKNNSSQKTYALAGQPNLVNYSLYFLFRLKKGRVDITLRYPHQKDIPPTLIPLPSTTLAQNPSHWHECFIYVRKDTIEIHITDLAIQKKYAPLYHTGNFGFLLYPNSTIEIKNFSTKINSWQLFPYKTLHHSWKTYPISNVWKTKQKQIWGNNLSPKTSYLLYKSTLPQNYGITLKLQLQQGQTGILFGQPSQQPTLLPLTPYLKPNKTTHIAIFTKKNQILLYIQHKLIPFKKPPNYQHFGLYLQPNSKITISSIQLIQIP